MPYSDPAKQREAKRKWAEKARKDPKVRKKLNASKKKQEENRTEEQKAARTLYYREYIREYMRKRRAAEKKMKA